MGCKPTVSLWRCGAGPQTERCEALAVSNMKRTIAYIDGFNLYYGLLQKTPQYKWLDPFSLIKNLLRPDHEILAVKFFTARIRPYPFDQAAITRQDIYINAISSVDRVSITEGYYNRNKIWLPHLSEKCKTCDDSRDGMAHVMKFEEKRSDVNLTSALLSDAFRNAADCFVLVSGDSDYITPVDIVRFELLKSVLVFNPRTDRPSDLRYHASYYAHIPRDLPAKCQLPEVVTLPNGRAIHRPSAWT